MTETSRSREAWITGIGLATSLGEGLDAHWEALSKKTVNVDETTFAPYVVHPMTKLSFDAQIPKKFRIARAKTLETLERAAATAKFV